MLCELLEGAWHRADEPQDLCVCRFWKEARREVAYAQPAEPFPWSSPAHRVHPGAQPLTAGKEMELGLLSQICCSLGKRAQNENCGSLVR